MAAPNRGSHREQADMILEGGVPDERLSVELEAGNSVAEMVNRSGRCGANGGADLSEFPAGVGRQ
jgi:hypothetical protein